MFLYIYTYMLMGVYASVCVCYGWNFLSFEIQMNSIVTGYIQNIILQSNSLRTFISFFLLLKFMT